MVLARRWVFLAGIAGVVLASTAALADSPQPWEMNFQPAATPVMQQVEDFHHILLWIISLISAFVLGLMVYVMWRFRESRNPTPTRTSHNTLIEVSWTVMPVLILVFIASKSFPLLYFADRTAEPAMTIKAIGHQWYWSYEYPDNGNFTFDANLDTEATGDQRLLATDNRIVVPTNTKIRLLVTADDVIHSWAMPSFGVKLDAVPGKINETWMEVTREGVFYGQCSELCGVNHAYMPIVVEAVSKERFDTWAVEAQKQFARVDGTLPVAAVAQAETAN